MLLIKHLYIPMGDFNSAVDTPFESELLEFCSSYDLSISDYDRYGRDSGQFTLCQRCT